MEATLPRLVRRRHRQMLKLALMPLTPPDKSVRDLVPAEKTRR